MLLAMPAQELRTAVTALAPHLREPHGADRLRQGHRARHAEIHDRGDRRGRARHGAGDPVGPELRRRCRARVADRRDDGLDDNVMAIALARTLGSATFRPYHADDVSGVEIGGAAKNVLAIAAGIVAGKRLGASALAALTTRGFAELSRFGRALDARPETLMGLSGLGDLILTCSSPQSRNFAFGAALGRGERVRAGKLAEGVYTAQVLVDMARAKNIDMPITHAVAAILAGKIGIDEAIEMLLTRPIKAE